jgi:hypothetical protein
VNLGLTAVAAADRRARLLADAVAHRQARLARTARRERQLRWRRAWTAPTPSGEVAV